MALTANEDQRHLQQVMGAGASRYVPEQTASGESIGAIRHAAAGNTYLDLAVAGQLVVEAVAAALVNLQPGGLLAVADYPHPGRPGVRLAVEIPARRIGWRRLPQASYMGAFRI